MSAPADVLAAYLVATRERRLGRYMEFLSLSCM